MVEYKCEKVENVLPFVAKVDYFRLYYLYGKGAKNPLYTGKNTCKFQQILTFFFVI